MIKINKSSLEIFIYNMFKYDETTFSPIIDILETERFMTLYDLVEKIGISPRILSKILYDINTTDSDIVINITNNFICNKLKKCIHIVSKYKNNIVYYFIKSFNQLLEYINQNSLMRIRGDTLCFSF